MAGSFQNKGKAPVYPRMISPPAVALGAPYPAAIPRCHPPAPLASGSEEDPVPAVPRSARLHAEEVSRRRRLLTPEQCLNPAYAADSPHREFWFTVEHEEQRRRDVHDV
ncbi:hypothetical protein D1007_06771 [Hordeum vulgare]|nr:hypothetical protein D1007_06771 [Hordeum vulgare]